MNPTKLLNGLFSTAEPEERATLKALDTNTTLHFRFNPSTLSLDRKISWNEIKAQDSPRPGLRYAGGITDEMKVSILFDESEKRYETGDEKKGYKVSLLDGVKQQAHLLVPIVGLDFIGASKKSVADALKLLYAMTRPAERSVGKGKDAVKDVMPPVLLFEWGDFSFVGVTSDLDIKITLFDIKGRPRRATADLKLRGHNQGLDPVSDLKSFDPRAVLGPSKEKGSKK